MSATIAGTVPEVLNKPRTSAEPSLKAPLADLVRFGPFSFDRVNGLLSRNGVELSLPPRAVAVLGLLIERAGDLVPKAELLDRVWKDTFVTEVSLTEAISLLRQTLGDDPQRPSYIQTQPRRGYRFVAPLTDGARPRSGIDAAGGAGGDPGAAGRRGVAGVAALGRQRGDADCAGRGLGRPAGSAGSARASGRPVRPRSGRWRRAPSATAGRVPGASHGMVRASRSSGGAPIGPTLFVRELAGSTRSRFRVRRGLGRRSSRPTGGGWDFSRAGGCSRPQWPAARQSPCATPPKPAAPSGRRRERSSSRAGRAAAAPGQRRRRPRRDPDDARRGGGEVRHVWPALAASERSVLFTGSPQTRRRNRPGSRRSRSTPARAAARRRRDVRPGARLRASALRARGSRAGGALRRRCAGHPGRTGRRARHGRDRQRGSRTVCGRHIGRAGAENDGRTRRSPRRLVALGLGPADHRRTALRRSRATRDCRFAGRCARRRRGEQRPSRRHLGVEPRSCRRRDRQAAAPHGGGSERSSGVDARWRNGRLRRASRRTVRAWRACRRRQLARGAPRDRRAQPRPHLGLSRRSAALHAHRRQRHGRVAADIAAGRRRHRHRLEFATAHRRPRRPARSGLVPRRTLAGVAIERQRLMARRRPQRPRQRRRITISARAWAARSSGRRVRSRFRRRGRQRRWCASAPTPSSIERPCATPCRLPGSSPRAAACSGARRPSPSRRGSRSCSSGRRS